MFDWVANNWGTVIVSLGLAVLLFFIVRSMIREKKRAKKCGGCMYCNACKSSCGDNE